MIPEGNEHRKERLIIIGRAQLGKYNQAEKHTHIHTQYEHGIYYQTHSD